MKNKKLISVTILLLSLNQAKAAYFETSCESAKAHLTKYQTSVIQSDNNYNIALLRTQLQIELALRKLDTSLNNFQETNRIESAKKVFQNSRVSTMDKENAYASAKQSIQNIFVQKHKFLSPAELHEITIEILSCK